MWTLVHPLRERWLRYLRLSPTKESSCRKDQVPPSLYRPAAPSRTRIPFLVGRSTFSFGVFGGGGGPGCPPGGEGVCPSAGTATAARQISATRRGRRGGVIQEVGPGRRCSLIDRAAEDADSGTACYRGALDRPVPWPIPAHEARLAAGPPGGRTR